MGYRTITLALNINLPSDLDYGVSGQPQIVTQMHRIALHRGETRCHPSRQSFAVFARENGFDPDVISNVRQVNSAAAVVGFSKECRDVRPFHKAIARRRPPKLR